MPHIHTEPGQHDMTVSAWILLDEGGATKCLVHFHRKIETLMQIGGHLELNQTPWQALAAEILEESGYTLNELKLLQPIAEFGDGGPAVTHPIPFNVNTHLVNNEHYHTDLCYGFVAAQKPKLSVHKDESNDLRWMSVEELRQAYDEGEVLKDVYRRYEFLVRNREKFVELSPETFSLEHPRVSGALYKKGIPGENR